MKIWVLMLLLSVFTGKELVAQDYQIKVSLGAGHAYLGTGDISGYIIFNEVEVPLTKRFSINPGIQFSNHSRTHTFTTHEYKSVTSGVTLYANLNYLLIARPRHRVAIGVGPSLRYQSSSEPSYLEVIHNPPNASVIHFEYDEPIGTWAPGYLVAPQYQYKLSQRCFLGARLMMQNDTRGDVITSQVLTFTVGL